MNSACLSQHWFSVNQLAILHNEEMICRDKYICNLLKSIRIRFFFVSKGGNSVREVILFPRLVGFISPDKKANIWCQYRPLCDLFDKSCFFLFFFLKKACLL